MQKFSTVDLLRNTKTVTMAADRQPVGITQHRRTRYVLMTLTDFEAMQAQTDPRKVYRSHETPPELAAIILPELDRLIAEGGDQDG
ncbi:type II toxin-antitoxin system Phd/YefM family antitoxin [Aureimonas sp. SK2]|uniref:type II toxin-antitoxin system Phd/YefM family antitoxin n=1 Tax=Aureimonas sp. SK2 TaxID=3015992 RepID=UPI0024452083|nr:type II toxin-antitoxin system Phd/YefM family antitoxin [Aureimonas sp. SK2]